MNEGDVAIAALPQADGQVKNRPIVILKAIPPFGDYLVCAVSTQLHVQVAGLDEVITTSDPDFPSSGLKMSSLIRLGYVATLPPTSILGKIGRISAIRHSQLLTNLIGFLAP